MTTLFYKLTGKYSMIKYAKHISKQVLLGKYESYHKNKFNLKIVRSKQQWCTS